MNNSKTFSAFTKCHSTDSDFSKISDENLYSLCKTYGTRALIWRQKFIGLLPEVYRRKLFEKKGFESIFVFAKKLAGLSENQVRRVLNLEERFEDLPELKNLLVNGEVSVNKLARVASIANEDNEKFLVENLKNLSQSAVETLVRDEKWARKIDEFGENQNGLFEPENEYKSVRAHTLNLSFGVEQKLIELQEKGIDINNLLMEFLQKREEGLAKEKEQVSQKVLQKEEEKLRDHIAKPDGRSGADETTAISRHIPSAARRILQKEFGTKCAIKNCQKLSVHVHHVLPFAIGKTHDPRLLVPLCKSHHELQHAVNERYTAARR